MRFDLFMPDKSQRKRYTSTKANRIIIYVLINRSPHE